MDHKPETQPRDLQHEQLDNVAGGVEHNTGALRNFSGNNLAPGGTGALENLAGVNTLCATTYGRGSFAIQLDG